MHATIKLLAKDLLPPFLQRCLRELGGGNKWKGDYPDWASAIAASSGYDAGDILERVRAAARSVRDGKAMWERDSVCFHHEEYNWQLIACLMTVAARSGGKLHLLDFGGALGSTYMQHRKLLSALPECSWSVVEQPHFVSCGKKEFCTDVLDFFESIEECLDHRAINVFLFSSVLQYLEDPYDLLGKVLKLSPDAIVIDRTPFANTGERITVQYVPKSIYPASYPCRFLDTRQIEIILAEHRILTPWFNNNFDPPYCHGVMSLL